MSPQRWGIPAILIVAVLLGGCQWPWVNKDMAIDHYAESQVLLDRGDTEGALRELAAATRADPNLSVAHAATGDIYRHQGNFELAIRAYQLACETNPYAFRPHYNLGWTYQRLADDAPNSQDMQDYLHQAVRIYLRAVALEPNDFDTCINLSACYFQQGKYDLSEKFCKQAITIRPQCAYAHSNLGIIYDSQNRLYDAIQAYKASLEIDTHQPNVLLNLGSTYMRQGRTKSAINAFHLAAEDSPTNAAAREMLGACYLRMREFANALKEYETAVRLNPQSAVAYRGIGAVYMSQYILDAEKTDLRRKGLAAWHASLDLDPSQKDLIKLIRKYAPQTDTSDLMSHQNGENTFHAAGQNLR